MQTQRLKKKKKPPGAEFEGCKWCQQLGITWPASSVTGKDVDSDSRTSWGVREYLSVYVVHVSHAPLCWGLHGWGQTLQPQAWVTRARQLQNLNLVWGLNHQRCEKHNIKVQCFCRSYHGLCIPRLWTLSLAGVLQTQFRTKTRRFFCATS